MRNVNFTEDFVHQSKEFASQNTKLLWHFFSSQLLSDCINMYVSLSLVSFPLSFSLFTLPSCSLSLIYFYFSASERPFTHNFSKQIQHSSYKSNCSTDPMIQRIPSLQSPSTSTTLLSKQNNVQRPTSVSFKTGEDFKQKTNAAVTVVVTVNQPFMDVILITCSKSFHRFFFYYFHFISLMKRFHRDVLLLLCLSSRSQKDYDSLYFYMLHSVYFQTYRFSNLYFPQTFL